MMSQILKSANFTKTQIFRYFENETFFLQIKKIINYTPRIIYGFNPFMHNVVKWPSIGPFYNIMHERVKNSFVAEVAFNKKT